MANVPQADPSQSQNGNTEAERLTTLVQQLQAECDRLRQRLAQAQAERDGYLKALYDSARAEREFESVDIESLRASSAGPVQMLD